MKKILVVALALVSLSSQANERIEFGNFSAYLGLNFASISTDSTASFDGMTGWVLGGRAEGQIAPNFYLVPGVQLAKRGFGGVASGLEYSYGITYLELPVLGMVKLAPAASEFIPYFLAGPNVGLKLGSSCSVEGASSCTATGDINTLEVALEIGGGVEYAFNGNMNAISGELVYHHGLTSFGELAGGASLHHRGVELLFGYHF